MVASEYLGERDGKVFLKRRTMSLVSQERWNEEIWFTETNNLDAAFLAQLKMDTLPLPASISVILFDSGASTHPSPDDSRWVVTNRAQVAALAGHLQSARVSPPDGPPVPGCGVVACVEIPEATGKTKRTFIRHVHFPTSVLLSRDAMNLTATNGVAFLAELARIGVPTNQLMAVKHEGK